MDKPKLTPQQEESLNEQMVRGEAFEEMTRTKGWELVVKGYYVNRLQAFTNALILGDGKPIEDFEGDRRELIGIRKLIKEVEVTVKALNEQREKDRGVAAK